MKSFAVALSVVVVLLSSCWDVSANEAMVRRLLNSKTALATQMEHQIASTRAAISEGISEALGQFTADLEEARRFATDETASFASYIDQLSVECRAGLPVTVPEILATADKLLGDCVQLAVTQGEEIDRTFLDNIEGFQFGVNEANTVFARDFFKSPQKVFTTDLDAEVRAETRTKAILWDNVDSLRLYEERFVLAAEVNKTDSVMYECIMDMKELVGTELGRIFLYSWEC